MALPSSLGQRPTGTSLSVTMASDQAPISMDSRRGLDMRFATISASSSGDNTIVTAVPGRKIKVCNYVLIASGTVSAKWKSGATDISGLMAFIPNSGISAIG